MTPDSTATVVGLTKKTEYLVRQLILPVEEQHGGNAHDLPDDVRRALQTAARTAGVFAPQVGAAFGGLGLNMHDRAPIFEASGYSLFGPVAQNCAAPDEGNMHLMERLASPDQQRRYLRPLAAGRIRSCFAMTEPVPGEGFDPSVLNTTAERTSGGWVINGRKWFVTGADGSAFAIVVARTSGEPDSRSGATMFLVDADSPGLRIRPDRETHRATVFARESELIFENLEVSDDMVLGEVDRGFDYAQTRLWNTRLTNCMRWLGSARRAADIAVTRAASQSSAGRRLGDLGMVQQLIADNEIDIAASRGLVERACLLLDAGEPSAQATSIAKTFVAEAVGRVVDRSLQICSAPGYSEDAPLSWLYREVRLFRIDDGPLETQRWAIARRALRMADERAS
ncbi:acyl-CoA dehydrogenase [Nocardia alba]|uniref:Acyl-CoA dehydrogenase n=2 Tax=Nocardia alba TaxID=225051 RepID=A0A4R1FQ79_9NOCA|nr:acyl-CoA dehydrogenase [Nocardia alba]